MNYLNNNTRNKNNLLQFFKNIAVEIANFWFELFYIIIINLHFNRKKNYKVYWPITLICANFIYELKEVFITENTKIFYYLLLPIFSIILFFIGFYEHIIYYCFYFQCFIEWYAKLLKHILQFFIVKNGQEWLIESFYYMDRYRFTAWTMQAEDISISYLEFYGKLKDWDKTLLDRMLAEYDKPRFSWTFHQLRKMNTIQDNRQGSGYTYTDSYFHIPWDAIKKKAARLAWIHWEKRTNALWLDQAYVENRETYNHFIYLKKKCKPMYIPRPKPKGFIAKESDFISGYYINNKFINSQYHPFLEGLIEQGLLPETRFEKKLSNDLAPEILLTLKQAGSKYNIPYYSVKIKTNNDLWLFEHLKTKYGLKRWIGFFGYETYFSDIVFKVYPDDCFQKLDKELVKNTAFMYIWEQTVDYKPFWEPYRKVVEMSYSVGDPMELWKLNGLHANLNNWPTHLPAYMSDKESFNYHDYWNSLDMFLRKLFVMPSHDPIIPRLKAWLTGQLLVRYEYPDGVVVNYSKDFYPRVCAILRDILLYENSLCMLSGTGRNSFEEPLRFLYTFQEVLLNWFRLGLISPEMVIATYKKNWYFENTMELYKQLQSDIKVYLDLNNYNLTDKKKFDIFFSFKVPSCEFSWSSGNCAIIFYKESGAPETWLWGNAKCKIFVMDHKNGFDITLKHEKPWQNKWAELQPFLRRAYFPWWYPAKNNVSHYVYGVSHFLVPKISYHCDPYIYDYLFTGSELIFDYTYNIEKILSYTKNILDYKLNQKRLVFKIISYLKTPHIWT